MEFKQLLQGLVYQGCPPVGQASLITQDSRKVQPGAVYVCITGRTSDGHRFAAKAQQAGAAMVVCERVLGLQGEIVVPDSRLAYALLCANFFGNPAKKLTLVAVTGTNGKTTVSSVLKQVLAAQGVACGLIGTIRTEIGDMHIPAKFTTPEPWDLHALLARMVNAGCTHAVMEASSQALEQGRLLGLQFALAIFTNLTQDHLDYHGTMQAYFDAKNILFAQCKAMLLNAADAASLRIAAAHPQTPCFTYLAAHDGGAKGKADAGFTAHAPHLQAGGVSFDFSGNLPQYAGCMGRVQFAMPGAYSVENALAAGAAALLLGCNAPGTIKALNSGIGVPGRSEVLCSTPFTVICDFAHTADAMEKLLANLRPFVQGKMLVLYGCAGERDSAKRPQMGESAVRYADEICYTADNPRNEPWDNILQASLPPLQQSGKPYTVQPDREQAVLAMLAKLQLGDMLVLCGKGHEDYQVLQGCTLYLSEKDIVKSWLANR